MIILRAIPGPAPIDENLLTNYESYVFTFIAILLIVIFIKTKLSKRSRVENSTITDLDNDIEIMSRDVLMQPKKTNNEFEVPFKNFSLDLFQIVFVIALFVIFCYLIF